LSPARALAALLVVVESVALLAPARGRPIFIAPPTADLGQPGADDATTLLATTPEGRRFLHEMSADDVARGIWGLRAAGRPVDLDAATLAEAIALHARVGALREARRAAAAAVSEDGTALAQATR
jgi:hypothetical protein